MVILSTGGLPSTINLFTKGNPFCAHPYAYDSSDGKWDGSSNFTGNNYTSGSCDANQLQVKSTNQGSSDNYAWCLDSNNYQQALNITSCPPVGGVGGTPYFPTGIQQYNLNNDYQWCGDDPNATYPNTNYGNFNLPCQFDTMTVIKGWGPSDIANFKNNYNAPPNNGMWSQLTNLDQTSSPGSDNSQRDLLYNVANKFFCSKTSNDCDKTLYENGVCPNIDSTNATSFGITGPLCQSVLSDSDIQDIMVNYCQGDNLSNTKCKEFCGNNKYICASNIASYCADKTPGPDNDDICACYYPTSFYDNLTKQAQQPYIDAGMDPTFVQSMISVQPCNYSKCATSKYKSPTSENQYCNSVCIQNVVLNTGGDILGNVEVKQNAQCARFLSSTSTPSQPSSPSSSDSEQGKITTSVSDQSQQKSKFLFLFGFILLLLLLIFGGLYFYFES